MSRIRKKIWRIFPSLPKKTLEQLNLDRSESDLPLRLPPRQKLGKTYKSKKILETTSLLVALALALIAPLTASILKDTQINTQSQAYIKSQPTINNLLVVDAALNQHRQPLSEGEHRLARNQLPEQFTIEASTNQFTNSVRFWVNGSLYRTDNQAPFSIAGDINGGYAPWHISDNPVEITATPYSLPNAKGQAGPSYKLTLDIKTNLYESAAGDCNGDTKIDTFDLNAINLEIYDQDGDQISQVNKSTHQGFHGCDANNDQIVSFDDLTCLEALILGEECTLTE